jgi:cell division septal protein FtsQ
MANGFLVLDENDWKDASPEQRDWMIFKTLRSLDERMQKVEKWSFWKISAVFLGSGIGGAMMVLFIHVFKVSPL